MYFSADTLASCASAAGVVSYQLERRWVAMQEAAGGNLSPSSSFTLMEGIDVAQQNYAAMV